MYVNRVFYYQWILLEFSFNYFNQFFDFFVITRLNIDFLWILNNVFRIFLYRFFYLFCTRLMGRNIIFIDGAIPIPAYVMAPSAIVFPDNDIMSFRYWTYSHPKDLLVLQMQYAERVILQYPPF